MLKKIELIKQNELFAGLSENDLCKFFDCFHATEKHYEKNSFIFMEESPIHSVGLLLSGSVHLIKEDFWGKRSILISVESGELFGEELAYSEIATIPLSAITTQPSDILLIDREILLSTCSDACDFHTQLLKNMIKILAKKAVMLTRKMGLITYHTTREKLLGYLSVQSQLAGSSKFTIPFNRQELAEYLSVNRSAMSNELSKMRDDGLLNYRGNYFELFTAH